MIRKTETSTISTTALSPGAKTIPTKSAALGVSSTHGKNEIKGHGQSRQLTVRGSTSVTVTIPINIDRENARRDNLVANRGAEYFVTSTSTE